MSAVDLSPRPEACLSDLTLDRLLVGELDGQAARAQQGAALAHLAICARCQQRRAEIEAQPRLAPSDVLRGSLRPRRGARRRALIFAAVSLLAAAAAGVVLFARPQPHGTSPDPATTRIKGSEFGFEVLFKSQGGGRGGTVLPDVALHPGDVIGFRVRSPSGGYLAVVSIGGDGGVSSYLPGPAGQLPHLPPGEQLVAGAVSLDAVVGQEALVAVLCAEATDAARALAVAKAAAATVPTGGQLPRLALPCAEARAVLVKEAVR